MWLFKVSFDFNGWFFLVFFLVDSYYRYSRMRVSEFFFLNSGKLVLCMGLVVV